jgi:hypothetical protein
MAKSKITVNSLTEIVGLGLTLLSAGVEVATILKEVGGFIAQIQKEGRDPTPDEIAQRKARVLGRQQRISQA